MKVLIESVKSWAKDRNLIEGSTPKDQCLKLVQEVGELSDSLCKGKPAIDDIGDCIVVLIILAEQLGLSVEDCLYHSYQEIKDRKGRMQNGIFIKQEDLVR